MSTRKVKCPFCSFHSQKSRVIHHIDTNHEEMIPEGYSAARVLFNALNHKEFGRCVVCKNKTEWNENTQKYNRLCGNPRCREALREKYKKNMIRVYGKSNILNDIDQQRKMLANRRISGSYRFSNGQLKVYTGSFERELLHFLDTVLRMDPDDILMPGPIIEYTYKNKTHSWITDAFLIPYNLIIEVKDGGRNPNKKSMPETRAKQVAKEVEIVRMGTYNYLRLTNNQFEQLIEIIYDIKMELADDTIDERNMVYKINEEYEFQ